MTFRCEPKGDWNSVAAAYVATATAAIGREESVSQSVTSSTKAARRFNPIGSHSPILLSAIDDEYFPNSRPIFTFFHLSDVA